jgi:type IV pilus assembly protein PilB
MALSNAQSAGGPTQSNLGQILVDLGIITPQQLSQALATGPEKDLSKTLVELAFTTEEKIMKGIGVKAMVPYFTSLEGLYSNESANIISEELARRLQVVPLFKIDSVVTVAMVNPTDYFTLDTLSRTLGMKIDPVVCMRSTIFETINKLYGGLEANNPPSMVPAPSASSNRAPAAPPPRPPASGSSGGLTQEPVHHAKTPPAKGVDVPLDKSAFQNIIKEIKTKLPEQNKLSTVDAYRKNIEKNSEDMPIVQLVDAIFKQAVAKHASDIHLEPYEDHTKVRFRIDGVLHPVMTIPKEFESALVARIKVMANLDITEARQPQDGRVVSEVGNRQVDLRISTLPLMHGEKTVIRILDKEAVEFKLDKLGFPPRLEETFRKCLERPNGIILVTGPTGSGKSTTLYTGLTILNSPDCNIVTLEDPVEYQLPGINQVQLNTKVGLTFARGLRSILRQDPDVIMVGEIRDQETGEIAIQSALTGHLVLSTLHTNDAPGAITRLVNMGIEPFLISASVLMIIAQRLIRVLCPNCKVPMELPDAVKEKLKAILGDAYKEGSTFKPGGCDNCHKTGFKGRRGIYEILPMTAAIRELTVNRGTLDEMKTLAKQQGVRTLLEEGAAAVVNGFTTVEEMMRVCAVEE